MAKGRRNWRCDWFGHVPGVRPPFHGWKWLRKHCSRCGQYPVGRNR